MPIVAPTLDGSLTELSNSVALRGLTPGATLTVLVNGAGIKTFAVSTVIQTFGFGATPFRRGDVVTATQTVGTETSPASASVTVGAVRTALPSPNLDPRVYVCASVVLVTGLVPGCDAEVEGRVGGGAWTQRGRKAAVTGSAEMVSLASPLLANEQLRVRQLSSVAGLTSNWNTARALAAPLPASLPAPTFTAEPRACTNVVSLTQVFVGVRVYYSRAGVPDGSAVPNASSVNLFFAGSPLSNGEAFGVKNVLDGCQIQSVETTQRAASRVPDAPVMVGKLCAGADTVNIAGLVPGALVEIQQDGMVVGTGCAPAEQAPFKIAPLGASRTIRVRQGLCSPTTWSAFSGTVTTGATSGALPLPTLEPVYDCGLVARVRNVEPGTRVEILSNINGTMGTVAVAMNATMADPVDVPLNRKAAAGETLTARVSGCSQAVLTRARRTWQTDRFSSPEEERSGSATRQPTLGLRSSSPLQLERSRYGRKRAWSASTIPVPSSSVTGVSSRSAGRRRRHLATT